MSEFRDLIEAEVLSASRWRVERPDPAFPWIGVHPLPDPTPDRGWKLHVSATPFSAAEVLRRSLRVLLEDGAAFKVAASREDLEALNEGDGGVEQIGKFITVYPGSDDQAVRLAAALDAATRGLRGPRVPSDRPLGPGSLVHYRYGAYDGRVTVSPTGQMVRVVLGPDGSAAADDGSAAPEDPFVAVGLATPERAGAIGGRYVILRTLQRTARGAVHLALDVETGDPCILKRAARDVRAEAGGRDSRDHLRAEADVLRRLAPDPRFPAVLALEEDAGDLVLVLERLEGERLTDRVYRLARVGRLMSAEAVAELGRALADALTAVHRAGFAYRDLGPTNVLLSDPLRLVDLEAARELGTVSEPVGTPGYIGPEQGAGMPASVSDDVFGLGAVLHLAATGADPMDRSMVPVGERLRLLRPGAPATLIGVIEVCLRPGAAERPAAVTEVSAALADVSGPPAEAPRDGDPVPGALAAARRLGDRLATAEPDGDGGHGPVLALAELTRAFGDPRHRAALDARARALAGRPPDEAAPNGLYVGEGGSAAALIRAGAALSDDGLIAEGVRRARWIARLPHRSPDLYLGTAGRLRLHLLVWSVTGDDADLEAARRAGLWLADRAEVDDRGEARWTLPGGAGEEPVAYLGYAHGAAGIADALLDLAVATGDERHLEAVRAAAGWLARSSVPSLEDGSGLGWPDVEGGRPAGALLCHGSTGIGRFFLHAAEADAVAGARDVTLGAARMVARGARFIGPTVCHGLAGSVDFLLDVARVTRDPAWTAEAAALTRLLEAYEGDDGSGSLVWWSDAASRLPDDYLTGTAGIALCLLRWADPTRSHLLDPRGFGYDRPRPIGLAPGGGGADGR